MQLLMPAKADANRTCARNVIAQPANAKAGASRKNVRTATMVPVKFATATRNLPVSTATVVAHRTDVALAKVRHILMIRPDVIIQVFSVLAMHMIVVMVRAAVLRVLVIAILLMQ
jgi:hypothetical protein